MKILACAECGERRKSENSETKEKPGCEKLGSGREQRNLNECNCLRLLLLYSPYSWNWASARDCLDWNVVPNGRIEGVGADFWGLEVLSVLKRFLFEEERCSERWNSYQSEAKFFPRKIFREPRFERLYLNFDRIA